MTKNIKHPASLWHTCTQFIKSRYCQTAAIGAIIFLAAFSIRLSVWQRNRVDIERVMTGVTMMYKSDAQALLKLDILSFLRGPAPPGNAEVLAHPPGYSILIAALFSAFGESGTALRFTQIISDAAAAVMIFLITLQCLPKGVAIISGALIALSPQLAYNSLLLLPDSLAVLPILVAIYFIIRGRTRPSLLSAIAAGALVGLSCWLRANALLLAPFLAVLILVIFKPSKRLHYAALLVVTAAVVIAPITLRNLLVFHQFLPLSLGSGVTLIEGIADYDKQMSFGLPATDIEVMEMEAKIYNRPDYASALYRPDGIERERARVAQGVAVIRSNPVWFLGVMLRRAASMLRCERVPSLSHVSSGYIPSTVNEASPIKKVLRALLSLARYFDLLLESLQKLFITVIMLPLIIVGVTLLVRARQGRTVVILLAIPVYYLCAQSPLHTEYRYVLVVYYFLYIFVAMTLYCVGSAISRSLRALVLRNVLSPSVSSVEGG